MIRYLRKWGSSKEEAEDITQDVLLKVRETYDPLRGKPLSLAVTTARNTFTNLRRSYKTRHQDALDEAQCPVEAEPDIDTIRLIEDWLGASNRRIKQMYLDGWTPKQIAKHTNKTVIQITDVLGIL